MGMEALREGSLGAYIHGGAREAWAPTSMEELGKLGPSFIYGDQSFLEEGTHLTGTRRPCQISDLSGSCWRRDTTSWLCGRDSSLGHGAWALQFSG
jgi:hypothetical protein